MNGTTIVKNGEKSDSKRSLSNFHLDKGCPTAWYADHETSLQSHWLQLFDFSPLCIFKKRRNQDIFISRNLYLNNFYLDKECPTGQCPLCWSPNLPKYKYHHHLNPKYHHLLNSSSTLSSYILSSWTSSLGGAQYEGWSKSRNLPKLSRVPTLIIIITTIIVITKWYQIMSRIINLNFHWQRSFFYGYYPHQ